MLDRARYHQHSPGITISHSWHPSPVAFACTALNMEPCDSRHPKPAPAPCGLGPLGLGQQKLNAESNEHLDTTCYLDMSSAKLRQLFANYLEHSHAWYQIFYTHQLHQMISVFIKRWEHLPHPFFAAKCSYEGQPRLLPESLVGDITVLLILAIGETCLHNTFLLPPRLRCPEYLRQTQFDQNLRKEAPRSSSSVPHELKWRVASLQHTT